MPILDKTSNLISLYCHGAGKGNVPPEMHIWSCLAGIAACVADRVALCRDEHRPLYPNIYVLLVGPSASGKGTAISSIVKYIENTPRVALINGKLSGMGLVDLLSDMSTVSSKATDPEHVDRTKMMLTMAELAFSIGTGVIADQFLKTMTELYDPCGANFYERTRASGAHNFKKPNITWLAGTTMDWLMASITSDHIMSGFFGRTCAVITKPVRRQVITTAYPADAKEVREHVQQRFVRLSQLTGTFTCTDQAKEIENAWFAGLQEQSSDSPALEPFEGRQHILSIKLAMLLSLADDESMVIGAHHMAYAQTLVDKLRITLPKLIEFAFSLGETKPASVIEHMIQKRGEMTRRSILTKARRLGVANYNVDSALRTLVAERLIEKVMVKAGSSTPLIEVYKWLNRDICARILDGVEGEGEGEGEGTDGEGNDDGGTTKL